MTLWFLRIVFLCVVIASTYFIALNPNIGNQTGAGMRLTVFMVSPLIMGAALVAIDVVWRRKNLHAIGGLFFGVLAGVAIGYVLGLTAQFLMDLFGVPQEVELFGEYRENPLPAMVRGLIMLGSIYLCASLVIQTKDDFRFIVPYIEFAKEIRGTRPMLLDTSVIIDGRIADVMGTRVVDAPLIIPRFVLAELHTISDSNDSLKRNRGRRGLDVLRSLQNNRQVELTIVDFRIRAVEQADGVDNKLVELAAHLGAKVMTTDYNLNKVAQLRGVNVVNLNDLANALKPVVLPGEQLNVKIIKPGEEAGQGVGYLDDGTMVVVEHGRDHIGEEVQISITSTLQTSAGKMIFGRLPGAPARTPPRRSQPSQS
ncbi:MAG: TRAM domain-containing protein [Planctomycetes bacterium]|nr:TRAM domain-containing protein [Planctomycetota bacterium]